MLRVKVTRTHTDGKDKSDGNCERCRSMTSILNTLRRMGTVAAVDGALLRLNLFSPLIVQNDDPDDFFSIYFCRSIGWSCKCRAFQEI